MYLYGASGHAKVIIDILEASGVRVDGLIDDNPNVDQLRGYPVKHTFAGESPFIISIGNNTIRKQVAERLGMEPWSCKVPLSRRTQRWESIASSTPVLPWIMSA